MINSTQNNLANKIEIQDHSSRWENISASESMENDTRSGSIPNHGQKKNHRQPRFRRESMEQPK